MSSDFYVTGLRKLPTKPKRSLVPKVLSLLKSTKILESSLTTSSLSHGKNSDEDCEVT